MFMYMFPLREFSGIVVYFILFILAKLGATDKVIYSHLGSVYTKAMPSWDSLDNHACNQSGTHKNIHNGIIFPSLNHAKIFKSIPDTVNK